MADYSLIIIGGGLSGLAAGIRFARFGGSVLILEQHAIPGGLNSYYTRKGFLLETGLHAMTNYAGPAEKHAPLNRLFRQLKLARRDFVTHEQYASLISFPDGAELRFSNDSALLSAEIARLFPGETDGWRRLVACIDAYDPFSPRPWLSTRTILGRYLDDPLLIDMLLLPLMVYGSSEEHDMDFAQFVIMFRAVFQEGFFRPAGTMKDFLAMLIAHFSSFGGRIRYNSRVASLIMANGRVTAVQLANGETISCERVISTIGAPGTFALLGMDDGGEVYRGRMSFVESITILPDAAGDQLRRENTIIFYSRVARWRYHRPGRAVDPRWGVICFPEHFQGIAPSGHFQVRVTHAANHALWKGVSRQRYRAMKEAWQEESGEIVAKIIGNYRQNIVYEDSFTPVTIEKFTGKAQGAVYGSPVKIKDGRTPCANVYIAGTDQGFLGIVGAMLSGVTVVNQHLLNSA